MHHWRTLRWSAWLGWQVDSNWASPLLFLLYVFVKPLAGSLLFVCMYGAARSAAGGHLTPGFLPFLYVGSACFMLVGGVTFGMSHAVVADRESYGMLKFIRISPGSLRLYLIGRGLSRAGQAGVGAVLTLAIGLCFFSELRETLLGRAFAWHWLVVFAVLGTAMLLALGMLLAGAVLNMARYGMFLSEGVAGVMCLLCGAVFPLDGLPAGLRPLSLALPPTYWLEGMRRALLGPAALPSPLDGWSEGRIAAALAVTTFVLALAAHAAFSWSERRAHRLGRYDETSGN